MYLSISFGTRLAILNVPMRISASLEQRSELPVTSLEHLCLSALRMDLTIAVPEMAVVLATRVAAETCPTGGTVHNVVNDELGIWHQNHSVASLTALTHGTKFAEFCLSAKVPLRIVPTDLVLELVHRVLNCKISLLSHRKASRSRSRMLSLPRYATDTVRYLPSAGSIAASKLFFWKIAAVRSFTLVPFE